MNQRDSSGLPLRAMVMVLFFLGVVLLLVALQYLGSDDEDDGGSAVVSTATSSATSSAKPSLEPEQAKTDVRVFNISETPGAAEGIATRLRDADWNVTKTGNMVLEGVPGTTVYFGEAPGERAAAEEVGRVLEAPVEPRRSELVEQPPGVIVVVTG